MLIFISLIYHRKSQLLLMKLTNLGDIQRNNETKRGADPIGARRMNIICFWNRFNLSSVCINLHVVPPDIYPITLRIGLMRPIYIDMNQFILFINLFINEEGMHRLIQFHTILCWCITHGCFVINATALNGTLSNHCDICHWTEGPVHLRPKSFLSFRLEMS